MIIKVTERDGFLILVDGQEYLTDPQGNGLWRKLAEGEQFEMVVPLAGHEEPLRSRVKMVQIVGRETFCLRREWPAQKVLQAVREWFEGHPPTGGA
jgi:S-adenosylmethionine:diacylglycerol 3-amino-3-carboxypropyl transferase